MIFGGAGGVGGSDAISPLRIDMSPLLVEMRTIGPPLPTLPVDVLELSLLFVVRPKSVSISPSRVVAWTEKPAFSGRVARTVPLRFSSVIEPKAGAAVTSIAPLRLVTAISPARRSSVTLRLLVVRTTGPSTWSAEMPDPLMSVSPSRRANCRSVRLEWKRTAPLMCSKCDVPKKSPDMLTGPVMSVRVTSWARPWIVTPPSMLCAERDEPELFMCAVASPVIADNSMSP